MSELEIYLRGKSLCLNNNNFIIFRNQDVDGLSFVKLTYEQLVNFPLNISARKATRFATALFNEVFEFDI
ncbi:9108_t:CDS:2 [Funneliformis caledonium]|uniref:9108_t:CDS:1 n=1 Tax=Funneliformis caledonium TaxID=1117310 RepID=A0A9N9CBC4_9GLOM|nr:9108_t:CDS:2 [Funneliformis caledonium]